MRLRRWAGFAKGVGELFAADVVAGEPVRPSGCPEPSKEGRTDDVDVREGDAGGCGEFVAFCVPKTGAGDCGRGDVIVAMDL